MSQDELRFEESLACEIVHEVLGVTTEPWDVCGRQAAVEALIHYPDGRQAALEVTIVGDRAELQIAGILKDRDPMWDVRSKWFWWVGVKNVRDLPIIERALQDVITICESHGVLRLVDLPREARESNPDVRHLALSPNTFHAAPEVPKVNKAFVRQGGRGGAADPEMVTVVPELERWLDSEHGKRKLRKLTNSGHSERHLFLLVTLRGLPFSAVDGLIGESAVPAASLTKRVGMTHLWVLPPVGSNVLLWSAEGQTWQRRRVSSR